MEPLKTLNGSKIWYSKFGVGKQVGSKIYVHKDYALNVVPTDVLLKAQDVIRKYEPGAVFNCICYDFKKPYIVRFDEAPRFDTDSEPYAGIMWTVNTSCIDEGERCYKVGYSNYIWHHKWLWVSQDYQGFDVQQSYEWSKLWLSKLPEKASGRPYLWTNQLRKYNLVQGGM